MSPNCRVRGQRRKQHGSPNPGHPKEAGLVPHLRCVALQAAGLERDKRKSCATRGNIDTTPARPVPSKPRFSMLFLLKGHVAATDPEPRWGWERRALSRGVSASEARLKTVPDL